MKFFLDTADIETLKKWCSTGLVDGVTTNPTLIAKTGRPMAEVIVKICEMVEGPVSAEVTAVEYEPMVEEGLYLAGLAPQVVVKVPLTSAGLQACKMLRLQKVRVNVTLCFSASQALLAAKVGASFISPFVGRLDDISYEGLRLLEEVSMIYKNFPALSTEILAASLRHPRHVIEAAKLGAHVVTMPPAVLHQMYYHPLTESGLEKFLEDWKRTGQSILPHGNA